MSARVPALPPRTAHWIAPLGAVGVVVLLWLLDVAHRGLPRRVDQLALAAAAVLVGRWLIRLTLRLWRGEVLGRGAGRALLAVGVVSLLAQSIGLGHEIGGLYFADEGTFLAEARRINELRALRPWFVYPHFLYYWDALALWAAELCGPLVPLGARLLWRVEGELNVAGLVTRCASALLAALAPLAVFLAARRLTLGEADGEAADTGAAARGGLAAGLLLAISPTFVEVGHCNISDVPATAFAAATAYGVALLLTRETTRRYVWTGIAAGLAAGSKYPAGLVALAIVAAWLRGVMARRRLDGRLIWAGLAALAAFVLATPSLVAFPGAIFGGEGQADVLFGARLYSQAAWQGIVRRSNVVYYLGELAHAFGWPALVLGTLGFAAAPRDARRRLSWALVFPALYLALLLALEVALRRNLMPALPFLAAGVGLGVTGAGEWLAARLRRRRLATAAAVVALALPGLASAALLARHSRPSTRELAAAWMSAHLPPGSFLVQEQYTPLVAPEELFPARRPRFAARLEHAVLRDPSHDYLILSSAAYQRFIEPHNLDNLANDAVARRYREIFATYSLVREWSPGKLQDGPTLRLYRLDPESPDYASSRRLGAAAAVVSAADMKQEEGAISFTRAGDWALFKTHLAAGSYRLLVEGATPGGRFRLRTRETEDSIVGAIHDGEGPFDLWTPAKVYLYLELAPASRITGLTVSADPTAPALR